MSQTIEREFFRTSGVENFKLPGFTNFPPGYPSSYQEDDYCDRTIDMNYQERRSLFVEHVRCNPGVDTIKGFFYDLLRIEEGILPIHYEGIRGAIVYVNSRLDCADFAINGLMRLYKQFENHELVDQSLRDEIKKCILDFKYWPDEPGIDSMCYWTENHHIIFSAAEYLAGEWFPEETFTNSKHLGQEKKARAKKRILRWLDLRFYTGFNEWLSNVYYDEDFLPLLNLYDFCEDVDIRNKAKGIIDIMLYDMACNSYKGQFVSTHGRTYTKEKLNPLDESTIDTAKLLFGIGRFANKDNMSAVAFALSEYRVPEVIVSIARDVNRDEWIHKQRNSIKLSERKKWGLEALNTTNGLELLSFGGYAHPYSFNHLALMLDEFNWWDNKFFQEFSPFKKLVQVGKYIGLTNLVAWSMRKDMSRNSFEESHIYTYRTPDYMLSTSQAYRPGYGGDQHHIWQATLDKQCVVFTTHPGGYGMTAPDAYWHGNGFMPQSIQHRNVNITIYKTPKVPRVVIKDILKFTHAYFPKERFDEVVEEKGWLFGRSNDGYVAIHSMYGYQWQSEGEYANQELIADDKNNIWITELGRKSIHGTFDNFIKEILSNKLIYSGLNVSYHSRRAGHIETGWKKGLKVNSSIVAINDYPKYDNPSTKTRMMSEEIAIDYNNLSYRVKRDS